MRIVKLEPSKHKKGRFLVHMEDGGLLRVGEGEIVSFGLYSGMELSGEQKSRLEQAARTGKLRDKALDLVSARPLSRKELIDKLKEREATDDEAEDAAGYLECLGLINDAEYARQLVEHYTARGYGPYKVRDELYRRGVPKEYWDGALAEGAGPEEAIDAFLRQKLKGGAPDRKELKRVSDALARRGFRWADINAGLRRYGAETEED